MQSHSDLLGDKISIYEFGGHTAQPITVVQLHMSRIHFYLLAEEL
jgi:hypothetical protein